MKYSKKCECCGHQVTAYTYSLNAGKVQALKKLVEQYAIAKQPLQLGDLGITNSQYTNFCHLQYFNLAQHIPEGWVPTTAGIKFIYREASVMMPVAVMASQILPMDHEAWKTHPTKPSPVMVTDIDETAYKKRPEYAAEKSQSLFDRNYEKAI